MTLLSLDRVTYTYPNAARPALRDVTVEVGEGELVVLAGVSGSGKSTLLGVASALVPHFHGGTFHGRAVVGGLDTRDHGPGDVAAVAGSLFQDPETQVVMGTARSELAFPLENRGEPPASVARGIEEAALALGLDQILERPTHELSGGELQRVALGATIAGHPRLLLLDEPTSQLDPVAGDELIGLLRRLNEEWGTTIVLCEHRLERCLPAADRVIALADGAIACDDAPRGFLEWAARSAPALQTPAARLIARAGLRPAPSGVKEARATLRAHGLGAEPSGRPAGAPASAQGPQGGPALPASSRDAPALPAGSRDAPALRAKGLWFEWPRGRAALRAINLAVAPGERVALMGRNGAGKSTLLRCLAGLRGPTRGKVQASGRVALLLQNPGDYLIHERVGDELPALWLQKAGLAALADRHPRDLSGGERQRLALAIVTAGDAVPCAIALDEPTRGMDRGAKGDLADWLRTRAAAGVAVLVATHDVEFAAAVADRVVLLGDGTLVADGPAADILSGGWYFATETARILGGCGGALLPEDGAAILRRQLSTEVAP